MLEMKWEGVEELQKKFETTTEKVKDLHKQVPRELVEWQTDDMRRQYPNIKIDETTESVEASTEIWPRSRLEAEPGFKRLRPTVKRGPKLLRPKGAGRPPRSTRPLLRTELFTKLVDRMNALLEAITWR